MALNYNQHQLQRILHPLCIIFHPVSFSLILLTFIPSVTSS